MVPYNRVTHIYEGVIELPLLTTPSRELFGERDSTRHILDSACATFPSRFSGLSFSLARFGGHSACQESLRIRHTAQTGASWELPF